MTRLNTALTRLLNITTPVLCAPMAFAGGPKVACEVTKGGGFGFTAADSQALGKQLSTARAYLNLEPNAVLPIGVGYLTWKLEQVDEKEAHKMLDVSLDSKVQAVWLAFGTQIGRWIEYIRKATAVTSRSTETNYEYVPKIFVQINSLDEALVAINDWKVDAIVAQGIEAGGHGGSYAPSTFSLVSTLLTTLPPGGPPIIATGGLSNGTQVAALLTLGAAGAAFGTRFLLTPESDYTDLQKDTLLKADAKSTVRTLGFDHARNTLGWPQGIDGRGIRNELIEDYENGVDVNLLREKLRDGVKAGDPSRMVVWAGQGVGEMKEIVKAEVLVHEIHKALVKGLQNQHLILDGSSKDTSKIPASL
ncbi:2-nitropropane dioxygenase [Abortiporus biennis]|nr:2-nitropropane dioxygenase [Abortiporus biennis]